MKNNKIKSPCRSLFILAVLFFVYTGNAGDKFSHESIDAGVFSEYPFSLSLSMFNSYIFYIQTPPADYCFSFPFTLDIGTGFEYLLYKWVGFEGSIFLNTGVNPIFKKIKQIGFGDETSTIINFNTINLHFQHSPAIKFYLPKIFTYTNKAEVKNMMQFFIRVGLVLDVWILTYYFLYWNGELLNEGHLFSKEKTGPGFFHDYYDYNSIASRLNIGFSSGFGVKLFRNEKFHISPELRVNSFFLPVLDGRKEGVTGMRDVVMRNNGSNDKEIADYKVQFQAGVSIHFNLPYKRKKVERIIIDNLNFYPDSEILLPASIVILEKIASEIQKMKFLRIEVIGHAASTGKSQAELDLSEKRARTVLLKLMENSNINNFNSKYYGRGSTEPIGDNNTEEGRRLNRRVEILLYN